jgi:uncharacterized protein (TIGR03435 family)
MKLRSLVAAILLSAAAFAQALTFEVASVKPAGPLNPMAVQSGKIRIGMKIDGAMVDIGSFTLVDLIRTAYEVKEYQVSGPDLGSMMSAERFNIQAKIPDGATEKQVPQMLQALLADRFKLVVHRETRDHAVYALVVAKGGLKIKESGPEAAAPDTPAEPNNQVRVTGNMEGGKGVTIKGGPMGQMHMSMADGRMHMEADRASMTTLVETLTKFTDRPVVDMTELTGNYRVVLDLSMDDLRNAAKAAGMGAMMGGSEGGRPSAEASEPVGSSIFMSLQQMGLKLEARKAPLPLIVIDHLEKTPTEN